MKGWKEVKVGDLGRIITGKTPSKDSPQDWGEDYLFLTPTDYKNCHKYADNTIRKLSNFGKTNHNQRLLPKDSIMVTCIGSDMGKVLISSRSTFTNQQINSIIINKNLYDIDFIYYIFLNMEDELKLLGGDGSAVPILNKSDFSDIIIEVPPLAEQRAITTILSSLDDKIDLLHRQNVTLEAMAEVLFKQWFVVEAKEEWDYNKLSYFGNIICGKTPSKTNKLYFNGEIQFIKIPDMHSKIFINHTTDTLSLEGANSQKNKYIPKNSICVSCIATVGLVAISTQKCQTNQQINTIIPSSPHYLYYLFLYLRSYKDELIALASGGTATLNLNTSDFSEIEIVTPPDDMLEKFHKKVQPIFDKIWKNQTQICTLEKLRDSLLPKLMSGEVRIKY